MHHSEENLNFIKDNHTSIKPRKLSEITGIPYSTVLSIMSRMGLKSINVIYREQSFKMCERLFLLGTDPTEISKIISFSATTINAHILKLVRVSEIETKNGYRDGDRINNFNEIRQLQKLGLSDFTVNEDEWELYRYRDLSPSEKLMYHGVKYSL